MKWRRYQIEIENSEPFIGYLHHKKPNHVYFSDKTPIEVDSDVLDEIEAKILNSVANEENYMKYFIVPKQNIQFEMSGKNKADALAAFAASMDSDMNQYFDVLTEKELEKRKEETMSHNEFVINFMKNELISSFGYDEETAREVAERAYDIYCEGNGETEYECIEKANEEFPHEMPTEKFTEQDIKSSRIEEQEIVR